MARSTHSTPTRSSGHLPGLDGLRALAVLAVLLYHAGVSWARGGFLGVDLFFVLSGFLITSLLLGELQASGRVDLKRFWLRRARRLLPAVAVVIGATLVAAELLARDDLVKTRDDAIASLLYVNNWHQIAASHSYFAASGRPSLLQHLWSLAVEEQFYLALAARPGRGPDAAAPPRPGHPHPARGDRLGAPDGRAVRRRPRPLPGLLRDGHPGQRPADRRAPGLRLARGLAAARRAGAAPRRSTRSAWPPSRRCWSRSGGCTTTTRSTTAAGLVLFAVAAAVLIGVAAHPSARLGRALGVAPLLWLGARSYGIYLWHWPVLELTRPHRDVPFGGPLLIAGQAALTIAIAALSYRFVEQPIRSGTAQERLRAWRARSQRGVLAASAGTLAAIAVALGAVFVVPAGGRAAVREVASPAALRPVPHAPKPIRLVHATPPAPSTPHHTPKPRARVVPHVRTRARPRRLRCRRARSWRWATR